MTMNLLKSKLTKPLTAITTHVSKILPALCSSGTIFLKA
nr:MAG TPA: hypothetical protein [Caudoviricetes sp.]